MTSHFDDDNMAPEAIWGDDPPWDAAFESDWQPAAHAPAAGSGTAGLPAGSRSEAAPTARAASDAGVRPIDWEAAAADGFARRLHWLALRLGAPPEAARWAARAAFAVSRATAAGHVCVPLDTLARRYGAHAAAVRAALAASGLAAADTLRPGAAEPLVVDRDGRIYLARYFDYEQRLARALVAHAAADDPSARHAAQGAEDRPMQAEAKDAGAQETTTKTAAETAPAALAPSDLRARLDQYFTAPPIESIAGVPTLDWQRVAAAVALSGRVTVVSGGPGTGKTTTVVGILACLLDADPHLRVALAAPTGKAAQRMLEALQARAAQLPAALAARLPERAYTLHRLLGSGPGGRFRHHREQPLPYDLVVVDEASMIDVALAAQLLDALAPGARLVLLGDKDQLAAVEAGAVFAELSARPVFSAAGRARLAQALGTDAETFAAALPDVSQPDRPRHEAAERRETPAPEPAGSAAAPPAAPLTDRVVWLERNYRFGLESPIGRLSLAIRSGDAAAALDVFAHAAPDVLRFDEDDGDALSNATLARLGHGYAHYAQVLREMLAGPLPADWSPLFDALARFRVLCATRGGARGTDQLNALLAAQVRRDARIPLAPGEQWFAGRPVMVTRNDYALGLFNGDLGIALPDARGVLRICFATGRAVPSAALPPHDTAFALTVHKSQGSEFDEAALVLPARFQRVLSRELVYTAVTRARERVAVVGARAVFAQAVAARTQRDSGLAARLAEAWGERADKQNRSG